MCALALLAAACTTSKSSNVPATPPEGFESSCAGALNEWADIRKAPDKIEDFLCIDAPQPASAIASGATLSIWAAYRYAPDVILQLQVADPAGHSATQDYPRHYDDPGDDQSFWLIHIEGAPIPIPPGAAPGTALHIGVNLIDMETGQALGDSEVTVSLAR